MKTDSAGSGGQFYKFTTTRPVAIIMVVLAVCVFGFFSYKQLSVNLMPDISYPSLTVRTEYAGTAPEEVETTISRPVEQALGVVNHLVSISSISKAGQSDVKLEFTWDTDMNKAMADVREKLDQVFLPEEAQRSIILRFDPSLDPIMRFGVSGEHSLIYLRYLAEEEIKRALERVEGVAAVKIKGGLEEEIRVELNEQQLTLIGIDIQQVRERLRQENVNLAGGNLKEGQTEYLVRTLNEFKSVQEVGEVVIGNWNGKEVKVRDVAEVKRTFKEREIITRINTTESVEIEIFKEADANIVAVAQMVKDRVFGSEVQQEFIRKQKEKKTRKPAEAKQKRAEDGDETKKDGKKEKDKKKGKQGGRENSTSRLAMIEKEMTSFITHSLPAGVKIELLSDQSVFIQSSVDEVKNTALLGGLLAIVVLFVFLRRLSVTLIIGLSIPISIIATFAPMKMFGVSLNIMSLGGLALGIGMLVDNSIVVLESISRCRDEGDGLIEATVRGVSEVGGAVFASTLTTIAVFFPIVFVEGVAGQVFGNMALTVVFSLFASLGVALFLIPMLSSRESSRFLSGVKLEQFTTKSIFVFENEGQIKQILAEDYIGSGLARVGDIFIEIGKTLWYLLIKILKVAGALLLVTLKLAVILLLAVISPIAALLNKTGLLKRKLSEWVRSFATNVVLPEFLNFVQEVWPTYLVLNALPASYDDMAIVAARFRNKRWPGRIIYGVLQILVQPFLLLKFVCHFIVELLAKVIHAILLVGVQNIPGALIIKGLFLTSKLVFTLPSRFLLSAFNRAYERVQRFYPNLLRKSLQSRGLVLGAVAGLFLFSILLVAPRLGSELIPEVHQGEFNLEVSMPVGTPVEQTDAMLTTIQAFLKEQAAVDILASVSGTDKTANSGSEEGEHTARLTVTMKRASGVIDDEQALVRTIRRELANHSGIKWKISRPVLFSFRTPVEVEIHGFNLQKLQRYARELEERMAAIPGVIDVKSNVQRGNPEVQIVYNRPLLAQFGLNISDIADIVRNKVRGDVATEFKERDRRIDVLVRLREEDKQSLDDLRRLVINPGADKSIPLSAVAEIQVHEGPSEIRRVDQQRTVVISANISERSLGDVSEDVFQEVQAMDLPEEFTFTLAGQNREMETSLGSLKLALALAIFLVYIVMASQFESVVLPFVIIFTIPLALIGVILWLFVFNIPVSIVVFLGMIMLAGIVVNNAIVLVDYINKLRQRGVEKMDAIIEAGRVRLRPILMTTTTTVLGLLPMALGLGDGAEIRTPMAITVIIGLVSSTLLTLIIIPTVYSLVVKGDN